MIVGIGVDIVNVPRFAATINAVSGLKKVYFTPEELAAEDGQPRSPGALAAHFAVKEAATKALGVPAGIRHLDCQVRHGPAGEPLLVTSGSVESAATAAGVTRWHVSLSHEGDVAMAMVIAERDESTAVGGAEVR